MENDSFKDSVETALQTEDTLVAESKVIDDEIQTEVENGKHTWEKPMVLTNPYKISPLTAMVIFDTEESCKVRVTVKGKTEDTDISGTLDAATSHRVPVVGLYAG
ncbi:MAG: aryl-sulfate sulfotransferase N-terminal domain-containing protein, partial [Clostridiaceae bacterium]|nr:aryl-sulfate sulfotransferase N-terminal domain-containing protein [Clostridiaceae bacterium]